MRDPEAGLQDIEQIVSESLNDQTPAVNLSQGPIPDLGMEPEAKADRDRDIEEHSTSPVGSTLDDKTT